MIVLIGGVHAVGKTYLAAPAASQIGFRHATASELIKQERGQKFWGDDKRVVDVTENQRALVRAIEAARARGEKLVLDGHFVLRGAAGVNTRVDVGVFRDMDLDGIVIVTAPSQVVLQRLEARGDTSWTADDVTRLMHDELEHSQAVARELRIPLRILDSPTESEFLSSLINISNEKTLK